MSTQETAWEGFEGLSRYPDQQVLYAWPKYEQRATLPWGAFVGQCDPLANGDEWVICRAGAGVVQGKMLQAPAPPTYALQAARAYNKGDGTIYLKVASGSHAIAEDQFAGDMLAAHGSTGPAISNRIMYNGAAAAATTAPEFKVVLQYPFAQDIAADFSFYIMPHKWDGVRVGDATCLAVGWPPITPTQNFYFWAKKAGDIVGYADGAITEGQALMVSGSGDLKVVAAGYKPVAVAYGGISDNEWGRATLTLGL